MGDKSAIEIGRDAGKATRPEGGAVVAYGIRSKRDGSYFEKIVPVGYVMFDKLMAQMRDEPWVKNGAAEIVPLYAQCGPQW